MELSPLQLVTLVIGVVLAIVCLLFGLALILRRLAARRRLERAEEDNFERQLTSAFQADTKPPDATEQEQPCLEQKEGRPTIEGFRIRLEEAGMVEADEGTAALTGMEQELTRVLRLRGGRRMLIVERPLPEQQLGVMHQRYDYVLSALDDGSAVVSRRLNDFIADQIFH